MKIKNFISVEQLLLAVFFVLPILSSCKKDQVHTVIGNYSTTYVKDNWWHFDTVIEYNQPVSVTDIGNGNISVVEPIEKFNLTPSDSSGNHFSCDTCGYWIELTYFPENDSIDYYVAFPDARKDYWRGKKIQ